MAYIVSDGEHRLVIDASRLEARPHDDIYEVELDGEKRNVSISRISPTHLSILIEGRSYNVEVERFEGEYQITVADEIYSFRVADEREVSTAQAEQTGGTRRVTAPMPGMVVDVLVEEGDTVEVKQTLLVLEAMKMQNEITAPSGGTVTTLCVLPGTSVNSGECLVVIEA